MTCPSRLPDHHPAEELLIDCATGAQSAAEGLMIGTHLALCPTCRGTMAALDTIGGAMLEDLAPALLPPNMLNRTLVAAADLIGAPAASSRSDLFSVLVARTSRKAMWRTLPGGTRMHRLTDAGSPLRRGEQRIWLIDAPAGLRMQPHRHSGDEWTVVLTGEIIDEYGTYRRGDFACVPDGSHHQPRVGNRERCLSVTMIQDRPRYTTAIGRLSAPFIRL